MQEIEIRVKGQIDRSWSKWLGTIAVAHTASGETVLTGQVRDQAALYGLLERLSSLGIQLEAVTVKQAAKAGEAQRNVTRPKDANNQWHEHLKKKGEKQ